MNRTEYRKLNNLYVADYRRNMKLRAVSYKGGKCETCGYDKSAAAMDFHHRNPAEKDFRFGSGRTRQWDRVKVELDKCDLLCKNCHAEIHDSWRAAAVASQREILRGHSRNLPVNIPCSHCKKPVRRLPSQLKYVNCFCNKLCQKAYKVTPPVDGQSLVGKFKIMWPSNEALKALVWEKPATVLAKELGVSDKAVKKRCVKLGIPTPGPGYWTAKKTA